jgi:hypothetical protein
VREAIAGGAPGGAFLLRFDVERPVQRLGAWLINRRTRWLGLALGDQAQFVSREAFARRKAAQPKPSSIGTTLLPESPIFLIILSIT